jgi:signal transduction histidine kinase
MSAFRSIRLRLLLLACAGVLAALALAGFGLTELFGRHIERRVAQELDVSIVQIAANLDIDATGKLRLPAGPSQPRFQEAYSGLYWQVLDESTNDTNDTLRSRSLWDFELALPALNAPPGESVSARASGPNDQNLFLRERRLTLDLRGGQRPVRITLAENAADIRLQQSEFARDLVPGLAILGLMLLAGAWFQVGAGLQPFAAVRRGIADIRGGKRNRLGTDVPTEIEPLVSEVNTLLDAQDASILRARDRAADLAHGLRTPLTALAADVRRLKDMGKSEIADDIATLSNRMHRTIEREIARSRARHAHGHSAVSVLEIADAISRTLARTPHGKAISFATEGEDIKMLADGDDLYDVLGNLMENAVRAAASRVRVTVSRDGNAALVEVEDDGANTDPGSIAALAARGARHDETGGAGLGLAIVSDVLAAYETAPEFRRSELGGLAVRFRLTASQLSGA